MATVLDLEEYRKGGVRKIRAAKSVALLAKHTKPSLLRPVGNSRHDHILHEVSAESSKELAREYLANAAALLAVAGESERRVSWIVEDCVELLAEEPFLEQDFESEFADLLERAQDTLNNSPRI